MHVRSPKPSSTLLTRNGTDDAPTVRDAMLAAIPSLRAFAIALSGNVDRAEDLVQETLLRAIANIHSFQPGSHMSAWLFTILRNQFRSEYGKRRREVENADGGYVDSLKSPPEPPSRVDLGELRAPRSRRKNDARNSIQSLSDGLSHLSLASGIVGNRGLVRGGARSTPGDPAARHLGPVSPRTIWE
jgi:RNA polymerase sigma factor (sigma-70 family)